ncbi:unnamed protein product [[Candida] boidinii]|nr:hypothetical protein BVG19_g3654 [[Candida] boidinii]OWB52418.1 hypothetical protein B5S27_g3993 [[Candida] boidinii]OWB85107.1 hypothetical protein B5S33_g3765 [[Candida] boidinii]GMF08191.1 unnamed protein product [[Candida] boidinii]
MNLRQQLQQGLNMAMVISSAYIFWKGLCIFTNSNSPLVVVLSGSMEPAFQRGDILFLWNRQEYLNLGDIVVYEREGKDIPIVHRILREHKVEKPAKKLQRQEKSLKDTSLPINLNHITGTKPSKLSQKLLTKGDNNAVNDLPLYTPGKPYLDREDDIIGSVKGYLPLVGYVTILISENAYFKYALLGLLALSSLVQNE